MTSSSLGGERPKSKRRWLRFSLSTLFVLALAVAGLFSGYQVGERCGYRFGLRNLLEETPVVRVYDVADLVPMIDPGEYPPAPSPSSVGGPEKATTPGVEADPGERSVARPSGRIPDFDSLIALITHTIRYNTWDNVGGPGDIAPHEGSVALVIRQSPFVHEEIERLFQRLREEKAARAAGNRGKTSP